MRVLLFIATLFLFIPSAQAEEFSFTFSWGDIPLCTSGQPNVVDNPFFMVSNVPQYTKYIFFKLTDENVPNYKHGGGQANYNGANIIKRGAFTYKSPCPPDGAHTYTWKAYALGADRRILASASQSKLYPE